MKSMDLKALEDRFGETLVNAFRTVVDVGENPDTVDQLQVGEAKNQFSEILKRASSGHAQVVRNRTEPEVVMLSFEALAKIVELAARKRRYADLIAPDPSLPMGVPDLAVSEAAVGDDDVRLGELSVGLSSCGALDEQAR